jgi:hypothetical protein
MTYILPTLMAWAAYLAWERHMDCDCGALGEPDPGVMTPSRGRVKPRAEDPFHRAITGGRP